jgi:NitT/TauT family transport system substrate-binding protein
MFPKRIVLLALVVLFAIGISGVAAQEGKPNLTYEQALACVKTTLPAEKYSTNEYLPNSDTLATIDTPKTVKKIKVGMPWVLNDEEAQLYNAIELGYFKDEGLEVELISGGPGKDHLQTLAGGAVDIAIAAGGSTIPSAVISPTPMDIMAVGTLLKDMPYTLITVRPDLLGKKLKPEDVKGTTIGVQQAGEIYIYMMLDKYTIPRDSVKIIEVGFTPEVILVGKADFYTGWIMNQPRFIQKALADQGKDPNGWNGLLYRDFVYSEPSDVIVMRRESLGTPEGQDLARRFLRAVYRGTKYMLDHPEESAAIAEKYTAMYKDQPITKAEALARFSLQKTLVEGTDKLGLLAMNPDQWNQAIAFQLQYGQIKIPCK